eukprot:4045423-Karenia_brevis.AAC.1
MSMMSMMMEMMRMMMMTTTMMMMMMMRACKHEVVFDAQATLIFFWYARPEPYDSRRVLAASACMPTCRNI